MSISISLTFNKWLSGLFLHQETAMFEKGAMQGWVMHRIIKAYSYGWVIRQQIYSRTNIHTGMHAFRHTAARLNNTAHASSIQHSGSFKHLLGQHVCSI